MRYRLLAPLALFLAAPATSFAVECPKPFTARHVQGDQVSDFACQGSMIRVTMPGGAMVADMSPKGKSWFIMDKTRDYYEYVPGPDDEQERVALEPCSDQKKLAKEHPGATCRKTGSATVHGRSTDKYGTRGGGMEPVVEYFDPELKAVLKEEKGGRVVYEMRDVKIGSVPATLFRVPAGYRKLSEQEYLTRAMKEAQEEEKKGKARK